MARENGARRASRSSEPQRGQLKEGKKNGKENLEEEQEAGIDQDAALEH